MIKVGIIGGSGLYSPEFLEDVNEKEVTTTYGKPSSTLKSGKIKGVDVILLARHGDKHTIPPGQVNYLANIQALKQEGCTHILATTAVGSLREDVKPGELVMLDQFIDFTKNRTSTFCKEFSPNEPKHTPMAEPFSKQLRNILIKKSECLGLSFHKKGTVVTIEGPRFSTKAESNMFRDWGADVINMSIAPECALANELEIPYAAVAMSTDYDCWKEDEEPVTWEAVMEIFRKNVNNVTSLLVNVIPEIKNEEPYAALKEKIRTIPHWPKPGIMFRDITTLLKDPKGLSEVVDILAKRYESTKIDGIIGIESRGFIIGSALSCKLGIGFIPIRKAGKLPAEKVSQEYDLEYGTDKVEVHRDAISAGNRYLLVDDLIATGGTALAACKLVRQLGGELEECCFIIDLPDLGGKKRLIDAGYKTFSIIEFEGE